MARGDNARTHRGADDSHPEHEPGALLGPYCLITTLARGSSANLYVAVHSGSGRRVALRTLRRDRAGDRSAVGRLFAAAQAQAAIVHQAVARVLEVRDDSSAKLVAAEWPEGAETLSSVIEQQSPLPHVRVAGIGRGIARALRVMHEAGWVHGELTPDHFLVGPKDAVTLTDLGLGSARRAHGGDLPSPSTPRAAPYTAPEQLSGAGLDHRSDIYAMGAILAELTAGFTPPAESDGSCERASPPAPLDLPRGGLDGELAALITQCLARDPRTRPQAAIFVESALARLGARLAEQQTRKMARQHLARRLSRAAVIAAVGLALAGAGYALSRAHAVLSTATAPAARP